LALRLNDQLGSTLRLGQEAEFHAFVRRYEAKLLIESSGFRAMLVGCELNNVAASISGSGNGPIEELSTDAGATQIAFDSDAFNGCAPAALMRDVRRKGQLHDASCASIVAFNDYEFVVRVLCNGLKRLHVRVRKWLLVLLALGAKRVISEHCNDVREVLHMSAANPQRLGHGFCAA
jgi:hypothetical protein